MRTSAFMTVDFEDARRHWLRDYHGSEGAPHPKEVVRQTEILLEVFNRYGIKSSFFSEGRLAKDLPSSVWQSLVKEGHTIGVHSLDHKRIDEMDRHQFMEDTRKAKALLEDASGVEAIAYRAPYFSADGCDPWFGEVLAECGFQLDSSRRYTSLDPAKKGKEVLVGSHGKVTEVPLASIGFGPKRLTVIGGTYFRLFSISRIKKFLQKAQDAGFLPMVYLHPYDLDADAEPVNYSGGGSLKVKLLGKVREAGRQKAIEKVGILSEIYDFQPLENVLKDNWKEVKEHSSRTIKEADSNIAQT